MPTDNLEELRRAFREYHAKADSAGIEQTIKNVIGGAMRARQRQDPTAESNFVKQLLFWSENLPEYQAVLSRAFGQLIQTTERQNGEIQKQIAVVREKITQLQQAGQKQQQWIERLILLSKIQKLQEDPRWNQHARALAAQQQAGQLAAQVTARTNEMTSRARGLMEQLDG